MTIVPAKTEHPNGSAVTIIRSQETLVTNTLELPQDHIRGWEPHVFFGVRFHTGPANLIGEQTSPLVPTAGTITWEVLPVTTEVWEEIPNGTDIDLAEGIMTVSAALPPLLGIRCTPTGIIGATNWNMVIAAYAQSYK